MNAIPDLIAGLSPAARRKLLDQIARRSLGHFHAEGFAMLHGGEQLHPGLHIDAMVHVLEQLALGTIKRLIITLPPRHGKSELVSGSFPAWLLGNDPTAKVTIASYGHELSDELAAKARAIVKHPRYARIFPDAKIKRGSDRKDHFKMEAGGGLRAASKTGAMTGLGTHFMIVDDFHKAGDTLSAAELERATETFRTTFLNRFDNLNDGRIVIVMQRIHVDDIVGWALRTGDWHHLCLPAFAVQDETIPLPRGFQWNRRKGDVLAPFLASAEYLEEVRRGMTPAHFNPQFQQDPEAGDGGLIDINWFGQYAELPERRSYFHKMVQSWDPAITERVHSDYSVGMTWGFRDGEWYLVDLIREQLAFNRLVDRVKDWHRHWRADALIIEGASIGHALYEQVRPDLPGIVRCPTPRLSKLDRLANCTVQLASGDFLLPATAPWLPALRSELIGFPKARHDDQVDALTQFVEFTFAEQRWINTAYSRSGRPERISRPERRPRGY